VSIGIDQISSVVQTNSATAEQSAAASVQLSRQANSLKELVSRFTLRREGKNSGERRASAPDDNARDYDGYAYSNKY
jgi:methyl-accepting chemotaxis protein